MTSRAASAAQRAPGPCRRIRVAFALLLGLAGLAWAAPSTLVAARGPLQVGAPAPPFALPAPEQGVISLRRELEQGPLLLSFWASWCRPCKEGLRRIDAWRRSRATAGRSLPRILCLNYADDRDKGAALWRELGLELPVAWDRYGAVGERYGLKEQGASLPLTLFISRDGVVRAILVSEGEDLPVVLDRLLEQDERRDGPAAAGSRPEPRAAPPPSGPATNGAPAQGGGL